MACGPPQEIRVQNAVLVPETPVVPKPDVNANGAGLLLRGDRYKMETGCFDERTERNISTLLPEAQKAARQWFKLARNEAVNQGYEAKIICGTRTYAEQNDLYRQRPKVTNARGGQSWHNFGLAWDFGIFQDRNYLSNHPLYTTLGKLYAKIDGLEWGGTWKSFTDPPHLQLHQFGSISEARRSFET